MSNIQVFANFTPKMFRAKVTKKHGTKMDQTNNKSIKIIFFQVKIFKQFGSIST